MKKVRIGVSLLLALVFMFVFVFSGCGQQAAAPAAETKAEAPKQEASKADAAKPEKKLKVAYLVADLENPAWKTIADGFTQGAKDLGMDSKCLTSSGDGNKQLSNAQDLITQKFDGIALSATDSSTAPAVLKAAKEANIPVVLLHIGSNEGEYLTMVRSDDLDGGYQCGKAMAEAIKKKGLKGRVAEISISLARDNGQRRDGGFQKAMKEAGIQVAEVKEAAKYTRDEAYKFTQDMITAYPDLIGVYNNYDEAALGCAKAVQDNNKKDKIVIGGYDGTPESVEAIKKGAMDCMSMQPLYKHGKTAAQILKDYIVDKKTPEKKVETPILLVTKDNIDSTVQQIAADCFGPQK